MAIVSSDCCRSANLELNTSPNQSGYVVPVQLPISSFYFCISQLLIITFPLSSSTYSTTWELHSQLLSVMDQGINPLYSGFWILNCLLMTDTAGTCHLFIFHCAFSRLRETSERTNMEDTEADHIAIVSPVFSS